MINLKDEYNDYKEQRRKICREIVKLEESPDVIKYKKLINQNRKLKEEEDKIYKAMKLDEYEKCDHILVITESTTQKSPKGDFNYSYCGCIKCKLDEKITKYLPSEVEELPNDKKIQYEYLHKHQFHINGIETNIPCGVDLGNELYKEIIKYNHDLDNETIAIYFIEAYTKLKEKHAQENPKVKEKNDDK